MKPERGWIYIANLDPQLGTEPGKTRPVVVLQTDLLNELGHPSTIVCPITTHVQKEATILRVHLPKGEGNVERDSDVLVDQIRAIDNKRFQKQVGQLSSKHLVQIYTNLKKVLDI